MTTDQTRINKAAARKTYFEIRAQAHAAFGARERADLERHLFGWPAFSSARTLLLYASIRDEVPTIGIIRRLLAEGRRVALPISHASDQTMELAFIHSLDELVPGAFGVPEPQAEGRKTCAPSEIEMAILPGLAFDEQGYRLGHGLGYYDRFLPKLTCPIVGLCYEAQISPEPLAREAHDRPVDILVSERGLRICKRPESRGSGRIDRFIFPSLEGADASTGLSSSHS